MTYSGHGKWSILCDNEVLPPGAVGAAVVASPVSLSGMMGANITGDCKARYQNINYIDNLNFHETTLCHIYQNICVLSKKFILVCHFDYWGTSITISSFIHHNMYYISFSTSS